MIKTSNKKVLLPKYMKHTQKTIEENLLRVPDLHKAKQKHKYGQKSNSTTRLRGAMVFHLDVNTAEFKSSLRLYTFAIPIMCMGHSDSFQWKMQLLGQFYFYTFWCNVQLHATLNPLGAQTWSAVKPLCVRCFVVFLWGTRQNGPLGVKHHSRLLPSVVLRV